MFRWSGYRSGLGPVIAGLIGAGSMVVGCEADLEQPRPLEVGQRQAPVEPVDPAPPVEPAPEPHDPATLIGSLRGHEPPMVKGLNQIVKSRPWAVALGKALFWDMQVGGDGVQACASCHFSAGSDPRKKNQLSPGLVHQDGPPLAFTFDPTASGGAGGPNYTAIAEDFPFHQLTDKLDRNSDVLFTTDDVMSSQGVVNGTFVGSIAGADFDQCDNTLDPIFHVGPFSTRKVEPRNTPTVINAAFFHRLFWDGRANNVMNGVDPFGLRNDGAAVYVNVDRTLVPKKIALENFAPASQAVGPPLSAFEMSCGGRAFANLGRRILTTRPLKKQEVDPNDSVLGSFRHASGKGLVYKYRRYVKKAFRNNLWNSDQMIGEFSQMESNFALFFGVAVALYESTLISDDTPFDDFVEGKKYALSAQARHGLDLFMDQGKCVNCHATPIFSKASTIHLVDEAQEEGLVERMLMADNKPAIYDNGFYNIGVTPTIHDIGLGGEDPFGVPLSFSRQARDGDLVDPFQVDPCTFEVAPCEPIQPNERTAVDGAFKVPGLRNVALTGPFFHNGGYSTLEQVVEFYNRGGNVRSLSDGWDTSGFGDNRSNLDPDITQLGLTQEDEEALVCFLKDGLLDHRVLWEKAPFDHPQLFVPNGHVGDEVAVEGLNSDATDEFLEIPAVGAAGRAAKGLPPLQPFVEEDFECCAQLQSFDFGVASDYNVFVFHDYLGGLSVQGRLAAGHDVVLKYFSVGQAAPDGSALVVGNDLTMQYGMVHGDVWYGNSLNTDATVASTGNTTQGSPIDFGKARAELESLSESLSQTPANGSVSVTPWGAITLQGNDATLNVFELSGPTLASTVGLHVDVPADSTVVINVSGLDATMQHFQIDGAQPGRVLFNFYEADGVRIGSIHLGASVLAPYAHVEFNAGSIAGTLVAWSLDGNGDFRNELFAGHDDKDACKTVAVE